MSAGINRLAVLVMTASSAVVAPVATGQGILFTSLQGWRDWVNGSFPRPTFGYIDDLLGQAVISVGSGGSGDIYGGALHYVSGDMLIGGEIVITTVHGHDVDPTGSTMILGGFDPAAPELLVYSAEFITSTRTGREFSSTPAALVAVAELSSLYLAGFDLSRISMTDPNSVVYVTQMTVPAADFMVPAPGAMALLGLGGLVAARRRR